MVGDHSPHLSACHPIGIKCEEFVKVPPAQLTVFLGLDLFRLGSPNLDSDDSRSKGDDLRGEGPFNSFKSEVSVSELLILETISLGPEEAVALSDSHREENKQNDERDPNPRGETSDYVAIAYSFFLVVVRDGVDIEIS